MLPNHRPLSEEPIPTIANGYAVLYIRMYCVNRGCQEKEILDRYKIGIQRNILSSKERAELAAMIDEYSLESKSLSVAEFIQSNGLFCNGVVRAETIARIQSAGIEIDNGIITEICGE